MEQHAKTEVELSQEELQDVTGGDGQIGGDWQTGAIVGTGLAGSALVAGAVVHTGRKVQKSIQAVGHNIQDVGVDVKFVGKGVKQANQIADISKVHLGNISTAAEIIAIKR